MNEPKTVCPQCNQEVVFARSAFIITCPACGARYSRTDGRAVTTSDVADTVMSVARVLMWVVIAVVALAGVGLAIIFVGCAIGLGGL